MRYPAGSGGTYFIGVLLNEYHRILSRFSNGRTSRIPRHFLPVSLQGTFRWGSPFLTTTPLCARRNELGKPVEFKTNAVEAQWKSKRLRSARMVGFESPVLRHFYGRVVKWIITLRYGRNISGSSPDSPTIKDPNSNPKNSSINETKWVLFFVACSSTG